MYETHAQMKVAGNYACYLMMKTLLEDLKSVPGFTRNFVDLSLFPKVNTVKEMLMKDVGVNNASKF